MSSHPQSTSLQSGKLLVLDLDETLVHATKEALPHREADFRFDGNFVYKRPGLEAFLIEAAKHFMLAIWSSGGDVYVSEIVAAIKPQDVELAAVWGRSKCAQRRNRELDTYYFEKRLTRFKKMGFPLERILIVDDSEEKAACNYGNAIYIDAFTGDPEDEELPALLNYLLTLKNCPTVRNIEKRYWRRPASDRLS